MDQCVCVNVMKFFNLTAPAYSAEIFHPANLGRITRRSKFKLEFPFRKSTSGQKCLSYLGPKIWNNLPSDLKSAKNPNTLKLGIQILALNETKLDPEFPKELTSMSGYQQERLERTCNGGGVSIYIRDSITSLS